MEIQGHTRYTLPDFPAAVQAVLDAKTPMFKASGLSNIRNSFIQVLFDDIEKISWYPTREMYADVLNTVCNKYPFLKDSSRTGYETLLACLRNVWKKTRVPLISPEQMQAIRAKYSNPGGGRDRRGDLLESTLVKKHRTSFTKDESCEDHHSIGQHMETMLKEMERVRPNVDILKNLLQITQSSHKELLDTLTTPDILQRCPYFKLPAMVLHEMQLLFKVNVLDILHEMLPHLAPGILKKCTGTELHQKLTDEMNAELDEIRRREMEKSAALLLVPLLFNENTDLLFTHNQDLVAPTPILVLRSTSLLGVTNGSIIVDGLDIMQIHESHILEDLATLLCAYYVYGIPYPKALQNTLTYFEHFIFKLPARGQVPVALHRVHIGLLYNSIPV